MKKNKSLSFKFIFTLLILLFISSLVTFFILTPVIARVLQSVSGINPNDIKGIANELSQKSSAVDGFIIAGVIFQVLVLLRFVVIRPIKETLKTFRNIIKDDGSIDLTQNAKIIYTDEIGEMNGEINKFLNAQQEFIHGVKETGKELSEIGEKLATFAQQTAGASTQISANIDSVKDQVTKQNKALNSVSGLLETSINDISNLDRLIE